MTAQTETVETLAAPRRFPWPRFLLGIGGGVLVALVLSSAVALGFEQQYAGRVKLGVQVAGVDLSGLDRATARQRLTAAYAGLATGQVVLETATGWTAIPYADIGRGPDVERMLDEAFAVGRAGDPISRVVDEVRSAARGTDLEPVVRVDRVALAARLVGIARRTDNPPVDAAVIARADGFTVTPSKNGRSMDIASAESRIADALTDPAAKGEVRIVAEYGPVGPVIGDSAAQMARFTAQRMAQPLVLTAGSEKWTVPSTTVRTWIRFETTPAGAYVPAIDAAAPQAALKTLATKIDRQPVNATFLLGKDGQIVGATTSSDGRTLNATATATAAATAVRARAPLGASYLTPVPIVVTTAKAALSTEDAKKVAPLMSRISTWTTYYAPGPHNGYGANISLPAQAIDGTVVAPGASFDFWNAIGEVSLRRGYTYGGAIINGHSVEGAALAGGICSTSTTLFNAVMRAGYEMHARANHYYYITRYPVGLDATVYDDGSYRQTMSWRNDTAYPVLIRAITGYGIVRFDVYSVPSGRRVSLSTPIKWDYRPSTGTDRVPTTSLRPGQQLQLEWPTDGFDASVTRTVTDANGAVVHSDTWVSHYAMMRGLIQYGVSPTPAPVPTPAPTPAPVPTPAPSPTA